MILLNKVCKSQNKEEIFRDLSFHISRKEYVFIYNQNQKSLQGLRKLLNGQEKPDSGLIRLFNKYDPDLTVFKYEVGVVFPDDILLDDRSLKESLNFIFQIKDLGGTYSNYRVQKTLELVDLKDHADCLPGELLPHQLVKANIAQALLVYPSLLIIEDSTKNLDEVNTRSIYHLLEEINSLGVTIVFLTTDKNLISGCKSKRKIYLKEGRVLAENKAGLNV